MHDFYSHPEIQQMANMSNFEAIVHSIWSKEDLGRKRFERQLATPFEPTPLPEGCFSLRSDTDSRLDDVTASVTLLAEFTAFSEPIAEHGSDDFFDEIPIWPQRKRCNETRNDKLKNPAAGMVGVDGFHLAFWDEAQEQPYDDSTRTSGSDDMSDHAENPATSRRWQERYNELVVYKQRFGNCCVPSQWAENPPLAQWVKRQRYQLKLKNEGHHSRMSTERKVALDQLGFTWDPHTTFWDERLEELERFREHNGHANVPTKYPQNPQLAIWAKCQRRQMKIYLTQGPPKSNMTPDRIEKLNRLGFVFNPRDLKRKPTHSSVPDLRSILIKSNKNLQKKIQSPKKQEALLSSTRHMSFLTHALATRSPNA